MEDLGINPINTSLMGFHLKKGDKKIMVAPTKNKIELKFAQSSKEDVVNFINDLGLSIETKDKASIESLNAKNPTPSIDFYEDTGTYEELKKIYENWLTGIPNSYHSS